MPAAARRVRQLRLRADSALAVRRVLPGLEDALRTATLPDAGGRLLLVRRLALGRIAADAASASLALTLERAVATARIDCVPATDPAAAAASAVWFRDALDAHVALALRVLEGPPPNEWFWRLAVPAWAPARRREAGLTALAASLAALPEAAAAQPAWIAALVARGHRAALVEALGVAELTRWLAVSDADRESPPRALATDVMQTHARVDEKLPTARDQPQAALPARLPMIDPTSTGAASATPERALSPPREPRATPEQTLPPPRAGYDAPARAAEAATLSTAAPLPRADGPSSAPAVVARLGDPLSTPPQHQSVLAAAATEAPAAKSVAATPEAAFAPLPADHTSPADPIPATADTPFDGLPTEAGGIAFVLPMLAGLGYPQWLAAHPAFAAADIARGVLAHLLRRLRVHPADPAWAIVASQPRGPDAVAPCAAAPSWSALALRGDRHPLHVAVDTPIGSAELVELWARAVHRALRRHARIGLADLVRRPALLQSTPTHIDLRFDLRLVDLRIRRAGLDLDPGWLPWFGRVIGFHYERRP